MDQFLHRSRVTKALVERDGGVATFGEAEVLLSSARITIVVSAEAMATAAGQAAALTAANAGVRTFGTTRVAGAVDVPLIRPMGGWKTVREALVDLGAECAAAAPFDATHVITIGGTPPSLPDSVFRVSCTVDGWNAGIERGERPLDPARAWNPLAGVFAGALAVREIFANVRGTRSYARGATVNLWAPWLGPGQQAEAPTVLYMPNHVHMVGLGHLGQAYLWATGFLQGAGRLVLQDYQFAGEENVATGLITSPSDVKKRKTRIASRWVEAIGWDTSLIEARFLEGTPIDEHAPSLVISALDSPVPRRHVLSAGFRNMIDLGVGHGAADFEYGQLRAFRRGDAPTWATGASEREPGKVLELAAYRALGVTDQCGAFQLASASVAVPFVGAAFGALAVAMSLRLGAMEQVPRLLQTQLSAPELVRVGSSLPAPTENIGTTEIALPGR